MFKNLYFFLILILLTLNSIYSQNIKDATITLPYSEFIKLIKTKILPTQIKPPLNYIILNSKYNISIENKITSTKIILTIKILTKDYVKIPIISNINIYSAYINNKKADLFKEGSNYYLIKKGPSLFYLNLEIKQKNR